MTVGLHLSIAGGFHKAIERATEEGADCLQIFCRSPRSWDGGDTKDIEAEAKRFRETRKKSGIGPIVVHASYLINAATPDNALYKKSLALLSKELSIAALLGAEFYVLHPGSRGQTSKEAAIERLADAVRAAVKKAGKDAPALLIENTAGAGSQLGGDLLTIAAILNTLKGVKAGLCFDTCHAFASGLKMSDKTDALALTKLIDSTVGTKRLSLIHLNDSKGGLGSNIDRHEHIGKGRIGLTGLGAFLKIKEIRRVPVILETPKNRAGDDKMNLKTTRALQS
ncbi:MAG: deoxyribonuclease IV [Deltaproteobacteria bacterium]|nr:deoxyribonuclease IV [Deltaproteobacteria bacterium]